MNGIRRVRHGDELLTCVAANDRLHPAGSELFELLAAGLGSLHEAVDAALAGDTLDGDVEVLPPVDLQEVWASGVTYERSREARVEEAVVKSAYDMVFAAERPELFMKMPAYRVPPPGAPLRIRSDSTWDVPEPELALVLTADGEIAGYLVADDLSSRSIEGENPLYLAQAKIFDDSLGLSDTIVLARDAGDGVKSARIGLRIERGARVRSRARRPPRRCDARSRSLRPISSASSPIRKARCCSPAPGSFRRTSSRSRTAIPWRSRSRGSAGCGTASTGRPAATRLLLVHGSREMWARQCSPPVPDRCSLAWPGCTTSRETRQTSRRGLVGEPWVPPRR